MISNFKISKLGEFGLLIEGLESDGNQYLNEENNSISNRAYRWDHSVTINTLATLNSSGDETFEKYYVVNHTVCCDDRLEVQIKKDGLYRIAHIILPTKTWITASINAGEFFDLYNKVYYYDESDSKFYRWKIVEEEGVEVEFKEIYDELAGEGNTIIRSDMNTFAMYHLNKCFNTLLKNILKNCSKHNCSTDEKAKQAQDRDMLWMFINVIKYSLELGKLYEAQRFLYDAQRFLEKFNRCNIICDNNLKTFDNGCGC